MSGTSQAQFFHPMWNPGDAMRILDEDNDRGLDSATIYLSIDEALQLRSALDSVIRDPSLHHHINDEDFKKEITICIYDEKNLKHFDERSKKLILHDQ